MEFKDITKKVDLQLVGIDGNAFSLMGAFQGKARREGWSKEEIAAVLAECQKGDYDHLLVTLSSVCEPKDDDLDDENVIDDDSDDDSEDDDDGDEVEDDDQE
jgi:hypothetical protein